MTNIPGQGEGPVPISNQDKIQYEKEYRQGLDLFQRALDQYCSTDNPYKKEAFKDVMDRAMQVLNDAARELKRTDLMEQNQKISQSFSAMQDQKADETVVATNLKTAKKSI